MDGDNRVFYKMGGVRSYTELIEIICARPGMTTMKGTFEEVAAWLQGLAAGLDEGNADALREWKGFVKWLLRRLRYPSNYVWSAALRQTYPEDIVVFEQLRVLFHEYKLAVETKRTKSKRSARSSEE